MKTSSLLVIVFVFVINVTESSAQSAEDSVSYLAHQIGFNITETISLFEEESIKRFKLNYRYKLNASTALRAGLNYHYDSSDTRALTLDIKAGIDNIFKRAGKWRFYTGGDLVAGIEDPSISSRITYQIGLSPFLGIIYYIGDHISLSTEPGLLIAVHRYKDNDTFSTDNSETWVEMDLVNVGQIVVGLHF